MYIFEAFIATKKLLKSTTSEKKETTLNIKLQET
jgi:hypothetical protein